MLKIIEIFTSVQGETSLIGYPTTFIRLAQCNLRCTWCDTTYSFVRGDPYTLAEICQKVVENGLSHVCVTGGEPLLQPNVYPLMKTLCDEGYVLSIETSGSLPTDQIDPRVKVILDIKCPGSGMERKNDWTNLKRLRSIDEVKFVLADHDDYLYAKRVMEIYQLKENVLFSPVHGQLDPKELVSWIVKDKLKVRLNLQIHKYIWCPNTKGV
jgi:7-carboxy-7-deazaguanine synthase